MCPIKACANLPHPIFFNIFPNLFLKNSTDLIDKFVAAPWMEGASLW